MDPKFVPDHYRTDEIIQNRNNFATVRGVRGKCLEADSGFLEHVEMYKCTSGHLVVCHAYVGTRPSDAVARLIKQAAEVPPMYGGTAQSFCAGPFPTLKSARRWLREVGYPPNYFDPRPKRLGVPRGNLSGTRRRQSRRG